MTAPAPEAGPPSETNARETHAPEIHALEPLFAPRSVAVIGASGRQGRPGNQALNALAGLNFPGPVYPVTPTYQTIGKLTCYPEVAALPEAVDLAIVAGATERVEDQLTAAIDKGARAAVIFAEALLEGDREPKILERIARVAREAALPLLGPNTIGYINFQAGTAATWFPPTHRASGPIAAIFQSGAVYCYTHSFDPRMRFGLTVHTGQEAAVDVADAMDYALAQPEIRVLAVYLETVGDPERFFAVLEKAAARDVPVVVLRPGRSRRGAELVTSHAGRLAGGDGAFEAVFRRHGVLRTFSTDELFTTAILLAQECRPGPGGLAAIMDSGGQRALLVDDAEELGLPWSRIGEATQEKLRGRLAYGLPPVNPLDAWAGQPDWFDIFRDCFTALVEDPDTAMGVVITEFGAPDTDRFRSGMARMCAEVAGNTEKPVVAACFTTRHFHPDSFETLAEQGIPLLDGGRTALRAIAHAFAYRDFRDRPKAPAAAPPDDAAVARWRARLADPAPLDEAEGLSLLADFGIPSVAHRVAGNEAEALRAAETIGYPVAVKTAEGLEHKTEAGGIHLGLASAAALAAAYRDLAARLGPRVLVASMAPPGVEVALGVVHDPGFGPLVMVGAGGTLVEVLEDRAFVLAPAAASEARELLGGLRLAKLLAGVRGRPPADVGALSAAVERLSVMAAALGETLAEVDINPVIVGAEGCLAVDALIKQKRG
ncbi:MAG: acetate--CoA ligase family protein [Kiloniellales bacterium]|nr:acetate--CoA ligase family protein [Kiloniellales bacterium]